MLAKNVNDNACFLDECGACEFCEQARSYIESDMSRHFVNLARLLLYLHRLHPRPHAVETLTYASRP